MDTNRKPSRIRLLFAVGVLLLGIYLVANGIRSIKDNRQYLYTPSKRIQVDVARTEEQRQIGLSSYESLGDDDGMLFIFDGASSENCFWMKDMKFAIDMVWINEVNKVVTVIENVSPDSYPQKFCPTSEAKIGLEVPAMTAEKNGIVDGVQLRL